MRIAVSTPFIVAAIQTKFEAPIPERIFRLPNASVQSPASRRGFDYENQRDQIHQNSDADQTRGHEGE
jgi:hypothetical protein